MSYCEFERIEYPTARKPHKCNLCQIQIEKGEKYAHIVSKCTGYDLFDEKLHLRCKDIQDRYLDEYSGEEYREDSVIDSIHESVCSECEYHDDCLIGYYKTPTCEIVYERYMRKK